MSKLPILFACPCCGSRDTASEDDGATSYKGHLATRRCGKCSHAGPVGTFRVEPIVDSWDDGSGPMYNRDGFIGHRYPILNGSD